MTKGPAAAGDVFVTSDLAARRIVALARVTVALGMAVLSSVEAVAVPQWYAWVAGLVWLPFASWLWFVEEGPSSAARERIGYVADLGLVLATMLAMPEHADLVSVVAMPVGVVVAYRSGLTPGATLTVAVLAMRAAIHAADLTPALDVLTLTTEGLGTLAVITLISRATAVQRRSAMSAQHFAERSDVILSRSSEGIVVTDAAGLVLQANPAAWHGLLGIDAAPIDVGQMHCSDLELRTAEGPLDCSSGCALAALCRNGQDVEVSRVVGDITKPFLANASRLPGAAGPRGEYLHSFRDITRLRQADEAKTMFLATASHELKTPLTVIRGFTQILRATISDEQSQIALQAIDTRSSELVAIVDRLLLSSRIEAGRVELMPTEVDVTALLEERMIPLGNSLGRQIVLDCQADLQAVASADALATAVEHLLDNAAKYSPDGGDIIIRAWQDDPAAVQITITDHGIGMSPEQSAHCFEKFWQAEATDVRRFGGTGIGLYIVHSLITGMGGTVVVDSRLGRGTTFRVGLPTCSPQEDAHPDHTTQQHVGGADKTSVDEFMAHLGLPQGAST